MKLVDSKTRRPIKVGDDVVTFRNELAKVVAIIEPRHGGSTGRVCIKFLDENFKDEPYPFNTHEYYPSVIGAEWEGRTDQ